MLVVEDDFLVRLAVCDFLNDCGLPTVAAADAAEALRVLQSERRFRAVVTDLEMPGAMNGVDLAHWLREHRPEIRVIVTSGHAELARKALELCRSAAYLPKPVAFEELKRLLFA